MICRGIDHKFVETFNLFLLTMMEGDSWLSILLIR
jgi:hypothetical protein